MWNSDTAARTASWAYRCCWRRTRRRSRDGRTSPSHPPCSRTTYAGPTPQCPTSLARPGRWLYPTAYQCKPHPSSASSTSSSARYALYTVRTRGVRRTRWSRASPSLCSGAPRPRTTKSSYKSQPAGTAHASDPGKPSAQRSSATATSRPIRPGTTCPTSHRRTSKHHPRPPPPLQLLPPLRARNRRRISLPQPP